jgi:ketosteroid isomerase-like protein
MSRALIETFYTAFQARDGATMTTCYHRDAEFSDPGFPNLKGAEIGAMWRMLTSRAQKFSLEFDRVEASGDKGSAHWVARYEFSGTGRMVENRIRSEFVFKDGLIIQQSDHFDFWTWSSQALGLPGRLLGWSGFFRRKVQSQAAKNLQGFIAKERK